MSEPEEKTALTDAQVCDGVLVVPPPEVVVVVPPVVVVVVPPPVVVVVPPPEVVEVPPLVEVVPPVVVPPSVELPPVVPLPSIVPSPVVPPLVVLPDSDVVPPEVLPPSVEVEPSPPPEDPPVPVPSVVPVGFFPFGVFGSRSTLTHLAPLEVLESFDDPPVLVVVTVSPDDTMLEVPVSLPSTCVPGDTASSEEVCSPFDCKVTTDNAVPVTGPGASGRT